MASNTTLLTQPSLSAADSSNATEQVTGWMPSDNTRGSIDILWSCCITIVLCCWVSTYPNVPSRNDKWYHHLVDKLNLACLGLAGPDYLLAIALGQLSSAWKSVRLFQRISHLSGGKEWTLVHGFFADMGGFLLASPDHDPFPVNSEQLHYLVTHGHVDYPDMSKAEIKALSKTDGLSKLIVLWQVLWFTVSELQRVREGLPMTTFELTALTFSVTMLVASICWYAKPTIATPTTLHTKDERTIEDIRTAARNSTHPDLPSAWYRTPLDFISPNRRFRLDVHFSHYVQISYWLRLPLLSREIKARPWDRFPSIAFLAIDPLLLTLGFVVVLGFSLSPLAAWNFHFPTEGERMAWRVCSVYHAVYSITLTLYYVYHALRANKYKTPDPSGFSSPLPTPPCPADAAAHEQLAGINTETTTTARRSKSPSKTPVSYYDVEENPPPGSPQQQQQQSGPAIKSCKAVLRAGIIWATRMRVISPDGDPDMGLGLHVTALPLVATLLYGFCRLFFYIEDFVSIREQPKGVYTAVNRFIPFMGA
ncbi:hypothetical protein N658DRAFT_506487 [Parathielavia hyrcaniae]|uniref:Uncharacterized protein n=1 Tax=Parathielavia hyrcaniae TaxID=113614 RepID=A0AAN6T336_9PEZI|nr:hypothetical protein N658DRAFT_506487 [Parathielavia hyrcaniae]